MPSRRVHATLAILIATASCGPIAYVNEVTRRASTAVDEARAAEADRYAPYWWTRATQYLRKAREIAAYADFQAANRFGRLATESAQKATEEAELAKRDPSRRPLELDPSVAPAKEGASPAAEPGAAEVAPAKDAP